jgi:hypothetical protein
MPRKAAPAKYMDAARATTTAALALAKARLLVQAYAPPCPSKPEVLATLDEVVEALTPRGGQRPTLRFILAAPTPAKRNGHNHAGALEEA